MNNKTAFIFPAFITSFTHKEIEFLGKNNFYLNQYLKRASIILDVDLPDFDYDTDFYQKDEFLSQIIAYTFSCAFSDLLIQKGIKANYIAGYSMGIYASLYSSKSVRFDDGIRIINEAFRLVREINPGNNFGMGSIVGLTFSDVNEQISKYQLKTEIININNERSLVIAGLKQDIQKLLEIAKDEGAFSWSELTVNTPYHSKYLRKVKEPFRNFISNIKIMDARIPVISTFNQREIIDASAIRQELVYNLTEKINWHKTMQKLLNNGVSVFYECGAGKDLNKIARFIKGDYVVKSVSKI